MNSPLLVQLPPCLFIIVLVSTLTVSAATSVAKPGCKDTCGHVSIPFPFGIGTDCFLQPWFEVDCKVSPNSNGSAKPFLSKLGIEVLYLDPVKELVVQVPPTNSCAAHTHRHNSSIDLRGSPYYFLQGSFFIIKGCPGRAALVNESNSVLGGCDTSCHRNNNPSSTKICYGFKCCQVYPDLGNYLQFYEIEFDSTSHSCLLATLWSPNYADDYDKAHPISDPSSTVPIRLSWMWGNYTFVNSSHSSCNPYDGLDPACGCDDGYDGNPYFLDGCQGGIDQCKDCPGTCYGSGSYCYVEHKPFFPFASILGSIISFDTLLIVCGLYGLYRVIKRRREIKRRSKFFKRNGGLLLQKRLLSNEGAGQRTKVFTASELDKATDHFSENRILGQGGQGTVYKGMLTDGKIVAIKKSKLLDKSQLEQFINEVVVLSQINHRNVVKLLGCCLETQVPLLVYEFVSNGTLSQHIHDPDEDFFMSWEMRLKIAADSAGAIAYLHSSSSTPIYHRDIKSLNILLDEKHRAKVADFGCSKTIAIDQTHSTTLVQGTWGYLDPEYFQTSHFTEKSDVYSFGVVLVELLTSKKPVYKDKSMEPKSLAVEFQKSQFYEMLDQSVVKEAKEEQLIAVVELTKRCISWSRNLRPTMKEVAMTLDMMIKSPAQCQPLKKASLTNLEKMSCLI